MRLIANRFLNSWQEVSELMLGSWTVLQRHYATYQTVITGHSLGGGVAHVCAADMKTRFPNASMSLYTFASPRVGNPIFADFVTQQFGVNNHRVTHLNDPVPRLPGMELGFVHTSPEYRENG